MGMPNIARAMTKMIMKNAMSLMVSLMSRTFTEVGWKSLHHSNTLIQRASVVKAAMTLYVSPDATSISSMLMVMMKIEERY